MYQLKKKTSLWNNKHENMDVMYMILSSSVHKSYMNVSFIDCKRSMSGLDTQPLSAVQAQ